MTTPAPPPVAIVGAGLVGLVLGQCLRRREIPARIYQRVNESKTHSNYGITLNRETYEPLLVALGMEMQAFLNSVATQKPATGETVSNTSSLRVNRGALTRLLREGLDIKWKHRFTGLSETGESGGIVHFNTSNGEVNAQYRRLIAADGAHSATRRALDLPKSENELKALPYVVFNGKRRMSRESLEPGLRQDLEQCFEDPDGITHRHNGVVLSIKADFWNPSEQQVAISYTLSRAATPSDHDLLNRSAEEASGLTDKFKDEVANLQGLPRPFDSLFNPEAMGNDRLLHWLLRTSLLDSRTAEQMSTEHGVVLVGDAAHAQPILGGNGANLAIMDALELAACFKSPLDIDAVAFYENRAKIWAQSKQSAEAKLQNVHNGVKAKASL